MSPWLPFRPALDTEDHLQGLTALMSMLTSYASKIWQSTIGHNGFWCSLFSMHDQSTQPTIERKTDDQSDSQNLFLE